MKSTLATLLISLTGILFADTAVFAESSTNAKMDIRFETFRVADLQVTSIDFGTIMINGQSGRIDMDRTGSVTFSGGVVQVSGFPQAGTLRLDADNAVATISFSSQVDMGEGIRFTPIASATTVNLIGVPETIDIYGSINFPAGVRTNHYSGILNISVTYN